MPINFDFSDAFAGLDKLGSPQLRESLGRSMAVAGGREYRDEAKRWVPVRDGVLRASIYVAFRVGESTAGLSRYRVSWNARQAPHGHLIEFGHWQPYKVVMGSNGQWFADVTQPLAMPKWVPAKPFLRPAMDIAGPRARAAMIQAGRERLPELLSDLYNDSAEFV